MGKLKIRRNVYETKLIGNKVRQYIDFIILICCLVVVFNIRPSYDTTNSNATDGSQMIYIFHDYEGNQYILNDTIHGAANSWDYLFDNEVPNSIKADDNVTDSVSLANLSGNTKDADGSKVNDSTNSKDNQISFEEIMSDLGFNNSSYVDNSGGNNDLIINNEDINAGEDNNYYTIEEENGDDNDSTLVIQRIDESENELLPAKVFAFTSEGWIIPTLLSRDELHLNNSNKSISYDDFNGSKSSKNNGYDNESASGISIIEDYASCTTPRGYKIVHGDSVLAYQQTDKNSDICNIERRFCWKGKLSGTYTQQGCYTDKKAYNKEWREDTIVDEVSEEEIQNLYNPKESSSTTATKPVGTGSFVFDQPSQASTPEYHISDNIRPEDDEVEQTKRPHWDCTSPWGEKVKHGTFVQAFKHSNGFSDAPCEAQLRLCTMGELMGTYTESSCKTRDTSFIDWINGSPTRDTYSKEKLELVKKQIKTEKNYEKDYRKSLNSDELDKILNILDK